ncbi:hypothetical protein BU15DRAFT_68647 [Melanogaster broomeanus]|nr:hypothetical protein BU15DRAFT_68647 [Melanogaster broomeanus]
MWASQSSPLDIPRPAMGVPKLLYGHPKPPLGHPKLPPWVSQLLLWASQTSTGASQTPTLDIPIATVGIPNFSPGCPKICYSYCGHPNSSLISKLHNQNFTIVLCNLLVLISWVLVVQSQWETQTIPGCPKIFGYLNLSPWASHVTPTLFQNTQNTLSHTS